MFACVTSGLVAPGVHAGSGSPPTERQESGNVKGPTDVAEDVALPALKVTAEELVDDGGLLELLVDDEGPGPGAKMTAPSIPTKRTKSAKVATTTRFNGFSLVPGAPTH